MVGFSALIDHMKYLMIRVNLLETLISQILGMDGSLKEMLEV